MPPTSDRPNNRASPQSFEAFWPYYLSEHRLRATRLAHVEGTSLALLLFLVALLTVNFGLLLLVPLVGYGAAWLAHISFERNQPATWRYPFWSLRGDLKMWWLWLKGSLEAELIAHNIMT